MGAAALMVRSAACGGLHVHEPAGFATLAERDHEDESIGAAHRSVSPDGVVFRVRVVPNEPEANLAFWREAMRAHLERVGYRVDRDDAVESADGAPGHVLALRARAGATPVAYLVALFAADDELVIAEAAGDAGPFAERRDAVLAAIRAIEIGA